MILIPTLIVSLYLIAYYRERIILFLVLVTGLYWCKFSITSELVHLKENAKNYAFQQDFSQNLQIIPTSERDSTWNLNVLGNMDTFSLNGLFPASRFCLPWQRCYSRRFLAEEKNAFQQKSPKWVLTEDLRLNEIPSDSLFLMAKYTLVAQTSSSFRSSISIYRRNE